MLVSCMNLKKMERHLRVNLLEPGPPVMKTEFTGPRSHRSSETQTDTATEYHHTEGMCAYEAMFVGTTMQSSTKGITTGDI